MHTIRFVYSKIADYHPNASGTIFTIAILCNTHLPAVVEERDCSSVSLENIIQLLTGWPVI